MTKNYVSHALNLSNHTSYDCYLWYAFVKCLYFQMFIFHFFKILIFWVVSLVKGQKMTQNNKKFCLLRSVSQELYTMWLSFMVHMCKIISLQALLLLLLFLLFFFHFLKILILGIARWVIGQKMAQNDKKFCLSHSIPQEPCIIYDCDFWYAWVKWWYIQQFYHFFKILVFGVFRGVKGQKMT